MELYTLELIDGSTDNLYDLIQLSQAAEFLSPGDRVVIGPPSLANNGHPNSNGIVVPGGFLQNGGDQGDAIRVVRNGDENIDVVSYENTISGFSEGESHIGVDEAQGQNPHSLGRCEDGFDSDENGEDFTSMPPSAGLPNLCDG